MTESDPGAEQRLYAMMQVLLARMAQQVPNDPPPWRGVVTQQDALDAALQAAAVIDQATRERLIPVSAGVHAAAMLMLVREYVQPLPRGTETDGPDPVTRDLDEISRALHAVREDTGLRG